MCAVLAVAGHGTCSSCARKALHGSAVEKGHCCQAACLTCAGRTPPTATAGSRRQRGSTCRSRWCGAISSSWPQRWHTCMQPVWCTATSSPATACSGGRVAALGRAVCACTSWTQFDGDAWCCCSPCPSPIPPPPASPLLCPSPAATPPAPSSRWWTWGWRAAWCWWTTRCRRWAGPGGKGHSGVVKGEASEADGTV